MSGLPIGWARAALNDTGTYINGMAFKPSDWTDNGLPIIRIQNLTDAKRELNRTLRPVEDRYIVNDGDILVSWSATLDAFVWDRGRAVLNQHIFKVVPDRRLVDKGFLYHGLRAKIREMIASEHLHGSTMKHINRGPFLAHEFPVPPLTEQRRIVAKIDSLSAKTKRARDQLDHVPRLVEKYKQAILMTAFRGELTADWRAQQPTLSNVIGRSEAELRRKISVSELFEPPYAVPASWRWFRLPELGSLDRGKSRHRPRNDPRLFGGSYPFIQTGDVRAADRFLTSYTETYNDFGLAQSRLWPIGTVCVTIAANIAETALLGIEACFPDSVVGFVADVDKVDPNFVEFFLRTARAKLEAFAPATAQKNINLDTLSSIRLPTPSLEEQQEIVRRIEAAFAWIDRLSSEASSARKLIDHLDQAILAKAFQGELVPQDPTDEPASVLLERIRAKRAEAMARPSKRIRSGK